MFVEKLGAFLTVSALFGAAMWSMFKGEYIQALELVALLMVVRYGYNLCSHFLDN